MFRCSTGSPSCVTGTSQGDFDLFSATHGVDLAKRVHACLGRALAKFVDRRGSSWPGAAELGILVNELSRRVFDRSFARIRVRCVIYALGACCPPVCVHAQGAAQIALSQAAPAEPRSGASRQGTCGGHRPPAARPRHRTDHSAAAKDAHRQSHRQGEAGREIGERYFRPRALPAAEGRRAIDGLAAACRQQAVAGQPVLIIAFGSSSTPAMARPRRNSPIRTGSRRNCTRQYPTADITVVNRGQRRRGRAGNDEAAADRGDRP